MAKSVEIPFNKLKLYLTKSKYKDFESVLKDPHASTLKQSDLPGIGTLYYKQSHSQTPQWIAEFFQNHEAIDATAFSVSGTTAVLLTKGTYKKEERIFAIPFGSGRHLIKELATETRFGLVTTLNMLEANGIRSLGKTTMSSNPKMSLEQISKASSTSDFQINIERDIVESITGTNTYPDFGKIISGKDALSITAKVTVNNLQPFLKKILETYQKVDYKKDFKWIDQIQEVRDELIIDQLNNDLVDGFNKVTAIPIWFAVPEIIDWSDFNGFKYSTRKRDDFHEDMNIDDYLSEKALNNISLDDLETDVVSCWRESKDNVVRSWNIYQCINAEISFNKELYFLDKSKWYKIETSFVKEVTREIKAIKPYKSALPNFNHKDEAAYNVSLAKQLGGLCLDAKNLQYGGGASKIEVCDILTKNKEFFHIKKYGGSANLSHLFAQGFVSGELFVTDEAFREKVKKQFLSPPFDLLFPKDRPVTNEYSIIYGVVTSSQNPLDIPFFSKVSLKSYKRVLEGYGFNVFITKIHNINPPTKKAVKKN